MQVFGDEPRPWVLVVADNPPAVLRAAAEELAPTIRHVKHAELAAVRQSEYDAAIVIGSTAEVEKGLSVVQFGGPPSALREAAIFGRRTVARLELRDGGRAERFVSGPAAAAEGVEPLVASTLIPKPGSHYEVLAWSTGFSATIDGINAFALEKDGNPLAGWVLRGPDTSSELWWLPKSALAECRAWIAAAFRRWRHSNPEAFPVTAWADDPRWMTQGEAAAEEALLAHETRAAAVTAELKAESERLTGERERARVAADAHERRLLTAQDAALVDEVAATLRELGFTVVDADALEQHAARKQEDLRVLDGDWVCLAEVKGYARRNAKTADLLQLGKAVEMFILTEKRAPAARWYIVNQSFGTPPAQRAVPFAGAPEVAAFAASDGLVIDTRELFRLREAVRRGGITPDDARAALRNARGVFSAPAAGGL